MKNKFSTKLVVLIIMITSTITAFGQDIGSADYSIVNIYRPKQGMMSGGTGFSAKITLNGTEIGTLLNGTMLRYKLYSEGSVKVKCTAEFGGSSSLTPYVENMNFENGKEYHILLSIEAMSGVSGKLIDEKKLKKVQKEKFADEMESEEDKSNPIVQ